MTHPALLARRIAAVISTARVNVTTEATAHDAIATALERVGLICRREVRLTPSERLDLMVDGVAVEVKISDDRRAILRQLKRYAALPEVEAIVLATSKAWPPSFKDIDGKPFFSASLAKGWL